MAPPAYQVRVSDVNGNLMAVVDQFRTLNIEHRINLPSTLTLGMYALDPATQYFTVDALIEVRRRVPDANLNWYTEFIGFQRTQRHQITTADSQIFTGYARGLLDLIKRRTIRRYADTAGSAKGPAPADDVIKAYVRENASSLATLLNGRVGNDGTTLGLSVAADLSQAPTFEGAFAWKNLLDAIRDIGEPNFVDVDVVMLTHTPPTFEFRTYYPRLGTDRRAGTANPFIFSPDFGNMENTDYTRSRTEEISSVLVLGPGEGPRRDTTLRSSTHITDSPWNLIEENQDASSEDRAAALQAVGDGVLYDKRPATSFSFDVIQTPASTYHAQFFLGDLATAVFSGIPTGVKIVGINVSVSEDRETIGLVLEQPQE